ncbi:MAG: RNA methyltransferase [Candidatus Aminicenantes bacterium]|nr:RNA methyltransferase [Candidatus Aminicenantes bacterium]
MERDKILNNIHFILVEPQYPGNIGSIARAMNTMGLSHLRIVNPPDLKADEAKMMAYQSYHIIENAEIFSSVDEAIEDLAVVVATTARLGHERGPSWEPREVVKEVLKFAGENKIGFMFGREERGLSNEELRRAHFLTTIPAYRSYPSLNLSQAAMLYAYTIYDTIREPISSPKEKLAQENDLQLLHRRIMETMAKLEFREANESDHFSRILRRAIGRTYWEKRDVAVFLKIVKQIEWYLDNRCKE